MKYAAIIFVFFCLLLAYHFYTKLTANPASEQQLEDVRKELAGKIDSVKIQIQQLECKVDLKTDSIIGLQHNAQTDIDSIKASNKMIFDAVKKPNSASFYDLIKAYLN